MRIPVLVVASLLLACGCSSNGSAPSGADRAAKTAFIARAEALCAKANTDLKALAPPKTTSAIAAYVHQVATLAAGTARSLAALPLPPHDSAALHARFLDPLVAQSDDGIRFDVQMQAVGADDRKVLALLGKAPTSTRADLAYLRSYGFHECVIAANTGH